MKNSDIFLIFAQNIDFGYTLEPPLTSTHNLCFRAKIRKKKSTPINPSFTIQKWSVTVSTLYGLVSMMDLY